MSPEQIDTLRQVQLALEIINEYRTFDSIGTPERADFDKIEVILTALTWQIVEHDITRFLGEWKLKLQSLTDLNKKIQESYSHLKKISDCLTKTAESVGGFIEFASRAL